VCRQQPEEDSKYLTVFRNLLLVLLTPPQDHNQWILSGGVGGGKNDCSLMLYLKTKHVFENFGEGQLPACPT